MPKITPFLWFNGQAEEAAAFYTSVFKNSKAAKIVRNTASAPGPTDAVLTAAFELEGLRFTALNAGPQFTFNQAISFVIDCETQAEVDYYWDRLSEGGEPNVCGWLKDKFGLSWQVTPVMLPKLLGDPDRAKADRVMKAMMQMAKLDIAKLEAAAKG